MTTSNYMPDVIVEAAFGSSWATPDADRVWTDISDYVELENEIEITGGRGDEFSSADANECSLVLDNADGRFTPGRAASPYYPNVKVATPIRVTARPVGTPAGNIILENAASLETDVSDWTAGGSVPPTLTRSTTRAQHGSASLLIAWGVAGFLPQAYTMVGGLVIGREYTASAYAYVPAGDPDVLLFVDGIFGSNMTTKGAFTRTSVTFTATAATVALALWPATAPASGDQCWLDAVMVNEGASAGTFTTDPFSSGERVRFDGYVDEWPLEWNGTDTYAKAQITAYSRLALLGRLRSLPSLPETVVAAMEPDGYYPFTSSAQNLSQTPGAGLETMTVSNINRSPTYGEDGVSFPERHLDHKRLPYFWGDGGFGIFGTITTTDTDGGGHIWGKYQRIGSGTASFLDAHWIKVNASGTLEVGRESTLVADTYNAGTTVVNDGDRHTFIITMDAGHNCELYVDGALELSSANMPDLSTTWQAFTIGDARSGNTGFLLGLFDGTLSHLTFVEHEPTAAEIAAYDEACRTRYAGETPGERLTRYADLARVDATSLVLDDGFSPMIGTETVGAGLVDLMRTVETTEGGVLFDSRDGLLTFHGRDHRYQAESGFTLSVTDGQVEADYAPKVDRSVLRNDVTATTPDGITARVMNDTSIDAYGVHTESLDLATTDVNEPHAAASWRTNTYGEPSARVPSLTVDLLTLTTSLQDSVFTADVGSRFAVTGLPSQAPDTEADFFVEGYTETIGPESYFITFNTTDAAAFVSTWVLDSPTRSQLGTTTKVAY